MTAVDRWREWIEKSLAYLESLGLPNHWSGQVKLASTRWREAAWVDHRNSVSVHWNVQFRSIPYQKSLIAHEAVHLCSRLPMTTYIIVKFHQALEEALCELVSRRFLWRILMNPDEIRVAFEETRYDCYAELLQQSGWLMELGERMWIELLRLPGKARITAIRAAMPPQEYREKFRTWRKWITKNWD